MGCVCRRQEGVVECLSTGAIVAGASIVKDQISTVTSEKHLQSGGHYISLPTLMKRLCSQRVSCLISFAN
ncbi:hypothetical protein PROFUN_14184 [Planoprotostelium fungivorum]|uniref:Uncharacterized protein n=1 Tax=Planoprotostelium fungivorum TaxID=1890364 RepID=A0A2P6N0V2_9EUKA|nr:hypothetical protein PROFUN_14184 [Planoprotostelium fungivorum]